MLAQIVHLKCLENINNSRRSIVKQINYGQRCRSKVADKEIVVLIEKRTKQQVENGKWKINITLKWNSRLKYYWGCARAPCCIHLTNLIYNRAGGLTTTMELKTETQFDTVQNNVCRPEIKTYLTYTQDSCWRKRFFIQRERKRDKMGTCYHLDVLLLFCILNFSHVWYLYFL